MAVQSAKDITIFTGSMDGDTQARFISKGNYIKLINGRNTITNNGDNGAIEDTEGNILVFNPYLALGRNKVIGSYEDVKDKSIIFFVWNSLGYHGIFRWYQESPGLPLGEIQKIYQVDNPSIYDQYNKNPLNFEEDYLITGIALVDNLLNWNCYNDEPKQMDIVKANDTNKKRVFDLYFNRNTIGQSITFNIDYFDPNGNLVSSSSVFDNSATLTQRVNNVLFQLNQISNLGYIAVDKVYYIELQSIFPGKYNVQYSDSGFEQSVIVPNNFYYNNVPGNFFYRIQMPPACSPKAYYVPTSLLNYDTDKLTVEYSGLNWNTSANGNVCNQILGISSELNDTFNNVIIGPTNYDATPGIGPNSAVIPFLYASSTGYIQNTQALNLGTFTVRIRFTVNVTQGNPQFSGIRIFLYYLNSNSYLGRESLWWWGNTQVQPSNPSNLGTFDIDQIVTTTLPFGIGARAYFYVQASGASFNITNTLVSWDLGGFDVNIDEKVETQTVCIRAKYVYENNQNSVYGQATGIILKTSAYRIQKSIFIDFNDKIISNSYYLSRLKNIVLSATYDNGTTWYDFVSLNRYQFACVNNANYTYIGNETLLAVSTEEAQIQFHAVPVRAQSLEYADSRLIDGGIVEGYDNIDVDYTVDPYVYDVLGNGVHYTVQNVLNNPTYTPTNIYTENPISVEGFRFGFYGKIGIVYYDDYDRKTGVLLSENPIFKTLNYNELTVGVQFGQTNYFYPSDYLVNRLKIKIYNEPPDWATKYRIVRTKDLSQTTYLMWCIDKIETVDQSGTVTPINPKYYKISVSNIGYYTEKAQRGSVIEYTYEKGDRVKLIAYPVGTTTQIATDTIDYPILESGADYFLIDYNPSVTGLFNGSIIEIYSKGQNNQVTNPLFYELSDCFEVKTAYFNGIKKKYHAGNDISVTNPDQVYGTSGNVFPASIDVGQGGSYFRFRDMYWDTTQPTVLKRKMWISSDYADEFTISNYDGIFRPNTPLLEGRSDLPSALRFSDVYRSSTQVNGLSAYNPLNIEKYNTEYGLLKKLKLIDNDVVKAVFENSFQVSIYVKQGVIKQTQSETAIVSVTDNVLSNSHIIQRTLGTQNPESVILNDEGDTFGYDENKGVVWRSSGNGIVQVSDYLQKSNFKNWSNKRNIYNKLKSKTPATYDIYHDEYIITLGEIDLVQYVPPKAELEIFYPKGGAFISIYIEENGLVICPATFLLGAALQQFIIDSFINAGFGAQATQDGTILVTAPGINYANYSIIVSVNYNTISYGNNLVLNNSFDYPMVSNDPWVSYYDSMLQQKSYNILTPTGTNPDFGLIKLFTVLSPANPLDSYCYQRNLGLQTGKSYEIKLDCYGLALEVGIGNPATAVIGVNYSGFFTQTSRTTVTYTFTFTDNPSDWDLIYIGMADQNVGIFVPIVYSVSVREIENPALISRYTFDEGQKGEDNDITPFEPLTISFSKQKNGWTHYYSFTPEYYGKINDYIVSFKDGQLYKHTTDAVPKNYYGVQYARELTFVCNKDFPKVKVFKDLMINGLGSNSAPVLSIPPYQGVPTGMQTELTSAHFSEKEGMQYAAIQRDKLTPGFSNTNLAWLNGRNMRGQIMLVTVSNSEPLQSVIYSTEILYFYSENS